VSTLIKPQELNQARLFSIDTRIKEAEQARTEDNQFFKDVIKKLIFAVEQNQHNLSSPGGHQELQGQGSSSPSQAYLSQPSMADGGRKPAPRTAKGGRPGMQGNSRAGSASALAPKTNPGYSVADIQFGRETQMLPIAQK